MYEQTLLSQLNHREIKPTLEGRVRLRDTTTTSTGLCEYLCHLTLGCLHVWLSLCSCLGVRGEGRRGEGFFNTFAICAFVSWCLWRSCERSVEPVESEPRECWCAVTIDFDWSEFSEFRIPSLHIRRICKDMSKNIISVKPTLSCRRG